MRILQVDRPEELAKLMREIGVDPYGIKIMSGKGLMPLIRINSLSNIAANILKQEMLSLGGDAAVSRGSLTGKDKKTDCLLMGNLAQIFRLSSKLLRQPFGLDALGRELASTAKNYLNDEFTLRCGRHKLGLKNKTRIMGVINLTPDSFSGDGLLARGSRLEAPGIERAAGLAEEMIKDGADIIDVGGESTRPGAKPVTAKEELKRVIPVIKALANKIKVPISIDTYKPEVALAALDNGACILNDITGLRNPRNLKAAAKYKAAVVIMHMRGSPRTMQKIPPYQDLLGEIISFLHAGINRCLEAGIGEESIIVDPGIGFGKTLEDNLKILKHLREFRALGKPILVGTSRKSFIGKILGAEPRMRAFGTVSSCVLAAGNGAKVLRVHDVRQAREALEIFDAAKNA